MRGESSPRELSFGYVDLESRTPEHHPIRKVRGIVDQVLNELGPTFDAMYASGGRPSIPPEQLNRGLLLQILFTIRSERQLMERMDYDLMFRWFVRLGIDDKVWHHSSYSDNRDRLMLNNIDELFFSAIKKEAYAQKLMSREHFSIEGTLPHGASADRESKWSDCRDGSDRGGNKPGVGRRHYQARTTWHPARDERRWRQGLRQRGLCLRVPRP